MPVPTVIGYVLKRFPRLSETFILRELLELERLGVKVAVFALGRPDEPTVHAEYSRLRAPIVYLDDVASSHMPNRESSGRSDDRSRAVRAARRLAPQLARCGVTHVHAHFATSAGLVARELGAMLSLPYSLTAHAKDIFHESVSSSQIEMLVQDAAFVVTVSDYNVRHLREVTATVGDTPIHRVYNGIDASTYRYAPIPVSTPARVLGVGRLVEKKGFDVFVDAVEILRACRPSLQATLIGTGRCEGEIRRRVADRGLADCITLPGALSQQQVRHAMESHHALAVPCVVAGDGDRDGLPTVITEAMALGLPVVATPVTGIPEIVRHGDTGLLVPERDPKALAAGVERLLVDRALRTQVTVSARQLIEQEFDVRRNASRLADLFATSSAHGEALVGQAYSATGGPVR
ncbi:MAG: glycosyltransferase [Acidobacteria bacterium]|nr:glycosyltransferase [Acidobacteriota bacterium]